MIGGLGMQELLVILAIVMLLFGGKRLPELGKGLGKAIRGFKQAEDETMKELKKAAAEATPGEKTEAPTARSEGVEKGAAAAPAQGPGQAGSEAVEDAEETV